jgi:hypothetical protein
MLIHVKTEVYNVDLSLSRNWTRASDASEQRQKEDVAVVFGKTDDILRAVQAASGMNVTSALQWVLVPLDIPQNLSSLGESTLIM